MIGMGNRVPIFVKLTQIRCCAGDECVNTYVQTTRCTFCLLLLKYICIYINCLPLAYQTPICFICFLYFFAIRYMHVQKLVWKYDEIKPNFVKLDIEFNFLRTQTRWMHLYSYSGHFFLHSCRYWQTAGEREGENPMKTPLPYIIIFGMSTPFIILAVAFANGWIKVPVRWDEMNPTPLL